MLFDFLQPWSHLNWLLTGALLYVEMHYRWWPLPSRYFRKEPEILADAPHRVEPGVPIPLLLLVKDAHRYPVYLDHVEVTANLAGDKFQLDDIAIAAEAKLGLSRIPNTGYRTPAATGIRATL